MIRKTAAVTAAVALSLVAPPAPARAATITQPLSAMLAALPVAAEVRTGYDRSLFGTWNDADGDGCTTRNEVLLAEATVAPAVGARCALSGGSWLSYVDGATWTKASDVDVAHVVAPAEAWDSGARTWTPALRQAFTNDLGDGRSLMVITDNVNSARQDKDPAEWLPPLASARCRCDDQGCWCVRRLTTPTLGARTSEASSTSTGANSSEPGRSGRSLTKVSR